MKRFKMKLYVLFQDCESLFAQGSDDHCDLGLESSKYRLITTKYISSVEVGENVPINNNKPEPVMRDEYVQKGEMFVGMDSGRMHSVAVSDRGNVYVWGAGLRGELGLEDIQIYLHHKQISEKKKELPPEVHEAAKRFKFKYEKVRHPLHSVDDMCD